MELKELESELDELEKEHKARRSEAVIRYCKKNNTVKAGDIVQSNNGGDIIKVERISYTQGSIRLSPECIYHGILLKKNREPRLDGKKGTVFQSRMINHFATAE